MSVAGGGGGTGDGRGACVRRQTSRAVDERGRLLMVSSSVGSTRSRLESTYSLLGSCAIYDGWRGRRFCLLAGTRGLAQVGVCANSSRGRRKMYYRYILLCGDGARLTGDYILRGCSCGVDQS